MAYTIKSGDTLSALAKANNTDIATLQKLNPNITDINKIYAGQTLNLPTAAPVAPVAPVAQTTPTTPTPAAPTIPTPTIPSPTVINTGDLQGLLTTTDLQNKLNANRQTYLDTLKKSQTETDLGTKLAEIQKQEADYRLSLNQGEQAQYGLGRPLALSTGRAQQMETNAQFKLQDYANQQKNILSQLGLAQEARKIDAAIAQGVTDFTQTDLENTIKINNTINDRNKEILDYAKDLNKEQRTQWADSLAFIQDNGIDINSLSPASKAQYAQLAANLGIDPTQFFKAAQNVYLKNVADLQNTQRLASGAGKVDTVTYKDRLMKFPSLPQDIVGKTDEQILADLQSETPAKWFIEKYTADVMNSASSGTEMYQVQNLIPNGVITDNLKAAWNSFRTQATADYRSGSQSLLFAPVGTSSSTTNLF